MDISAIGRGLVRGTVDVLRRFGVGPQGDQKVSKFLPDFTALCADGRVWRCQQTTATAPVQALPTTTFLFTLGNNEPDDGLWYVMLAATCFVVTDANALDNHGMAACVSQLPATTGGITSTLAQDQAKTTIKSMGGVRGGGYPGKAILDTGGTFTDDDWFPLERSSGSTAVNSGKGVGFWSWINGLIVLPPKTMMGVVSTATDNATATTRVGLIWAEVPKNWLLAS